MSKLRSLTRLSYAYGIVGLALALMAAFGGDELGSAAVFVGMILVAPAAFIALRNEHIEKNTFRGIWFLAAFYGAFELVPVVFSGRTEVVVSSMLDMLGNVVLIVLLVLIVSRRRGRLDAADLIDGTIIALGTWLVSWVTLVRPLVGQDGSDQLEVVLDVAYLPFSVPIIGLVMMFLFSGRLDRASNWLLAAALVLNVLGDLTYALQQAGAVGPWAATLANTMYVACFACGGAALVHPTAPEIFAGGYARTQIGLTKRTVGLVVALIIPVMVLALVPADSTTDTIVRATSVFALLVMTGVRLYQATDASIKNQQRLLDAARIDDLTGLPNKSAVLEIATDSIDHSWRTNRCPSLYLFDLDRFKNINDSLGHSSGDDVIMVIAERLKLAAAALGASVGRPAGDEFLVFDPTPTSEHQALNHAEVLHSVFKEPITTAEGVVFVTASVGVASMPAGRPISGEEMFRWADIAMYRAKDSGRNCLALYNPSMQDRVSQRMRVETELHGALEKGEFRLYHQPIVELETGRVTGFEALIRWQKSDGSMVSPAQFIPIAEDTGLIAEIGSWALIEALTQLYTWTEDGVVPPAVTVSVNVSPRQLADPKFPDVVEEALQRTGIDPHRLWLEVTESVMVENPEVAQDSLRRIRTMGARIALDDFGTGYSSLSLLQQFPIQRIKIDRAFVKGLDSSPNDRSLVRTVINLGDSLGMDIVAEGVETIEQLRQLRSYGCDKSQGFLISHPVPPEAVRSTVAALESLSQWPEFATVVGHSPMQPGPLHQR